MHQFMHEAVAAEDAGTNPGLPASRRPASLRLDFHSRPSAHPSMFAVELDTVGEHSGLHATVEVANLPTNEKGETVSTDGLDTPQALPPPGPIV